MSSPTIRRFFFWLTVFLMVPPVPAADSEPVGPSGSALRRAAAELPSVTTTLYSGLGTANAERASCEVALEPSTDAFNVATYFSWYRKRSQFRCMSAKPIEGAFRSSNRGRLRKHLERLALHGFDGIAGVIYADPDGSSEVAREMRWMRLAVREAKATGLKFVPFYDFSIATYYSARLCNVFAGPCPPGFEPISEFNFDRHPILQTTVVDNLVMIADQFILPYVDLQRPAESSIKFLQYADGRIVRDELGLPRPEIYIYIPRVWSDDSGFATIIRVLEAITEAYRARGLGKPAYTLDVLEPSSRTFNPHLVAAFSDTAVRLTSFFAVRKKADDLGELAREHQKLYRRAGRKLARHINRGELHPRLQIAAGTAVNFDKRAWAACNGGFLDLAWPAMEAEDWLEALTTMVEYTQQPMCKAGGAPVPGELSYQNNRYVYAGEGFESTWLCAKEGEGGSRYPNRYGCEPLVGFGELMRQLGEL
jgi:hypothetical protein